MSPSGINKWAKGSALPNAYQLVAVCHALDLDVDVSYFCSSHTPALNDAGLAKVREYKDDLIASGKYKPQPKVVDVYKRQVFSRLVALILNAGRSVPLIYQGIIA